MYNDVKKALCDQWTEAQIAARDKSKGFTKPKKSVAFGVDADEDGEWEEDGEWDGEWEAEPVVEAFGEVGACPIAHLHVDMSRTRLGRVSEVSRVAHRLATCDGRPPPRRRAPAACS